MAYETFAGIALIAIVAGAFLDCCWLTISSLPRLDEDDPSRLLREVEEPVHSNPERRYREAQGEE